MDPISNFSDEDLIALRLMAEAGDVPPPPPDYATGTGFDDGDRTTDRLIQLGRFRALTWWLLLRRLR